MYVPYTHKPKRLQIKKMQLPHIIDSSNANSYGQKEIRQKAGLQTQRHLHIVDPLTIQKNRLKRK